VIAIINAIISAFGAVLSAILSLLPSSPFQAVSGIDAAWLQAICWIFPVTSVIAHLEAFVTAVAVYYGIRVVLRWVKVVSS